MERVCDVADDPRERRRRIEAAQGANTREIRASMGKILKPIGVRFMVRDRSQNGRRLQRLDHQLCKI